MEQKTIQTIGVVGAGVMGRGIVQLIAQHNHKVILFDQDFQQCEQAIASIGERLQRMVNKTMQAEQVDDVLSNISIAKSLQDFSELDLLIEAVIEEVEVKQNLFKQLETICRMDCIFASNTSTLSITSLAAKMKTPHRLIGIHFFNPVPLMKLVELVYGLKTDKKIIEKSKLLAQFWGKKVVTCSSTPGFIVNRVSRPFYVEPLALKESTDIEFSVIDGLLVASGQFRMGVFELIDLIGVDVNYRNSYSLFKEFYFDKRYKPSLIQKEYVEAGLLGRKTGIGFYNYSVAKPKTALQKLEEKFMSHSNNDTAINTTEVEISCVINKKCTHNQPFNSLLARFEKSNNAIKKYFLVIEGPSYFSIHGIKCFIHYGKTAAEISRQHKESVCVFDWSIDYQQGNFLGVSLCIVNETIEKDFFLDVLQKLLKVSLICLPDTPALIVARSIAMLINEACDAVHQGVCTPEDADTAVIYGLNYRKGLFALAEYFGWVQIRQTIEGLMRYYEIERYRVSPLLKLNANSNY